MRRKKRKKSAQNKIGVEFKYLVDAFKYTDKIAIKELKPFTLILLKTASFSYRIALKDPKRGICVMCGTNKEICSKPTHCFIQGSVIYPNSSSIFSCFIIKGFCLEISLYSTKRSIWLSPTESVKIEIDSELAGQMILQNNLDLH